MSCNASYTRFNFFLESFSSELQFDMHSYLHKIFILAKSGCYTGLSSKLPSLMFVSGPVLTLTLDGAEKSLMHLRAAISAGSCGGGDP
jgi:hypothetical protein